MKFSTTQDLPLLDVLKQMFPDCSNTTLRSFIKEERVTVDQTYPKDLRTIVKAGEQVVVGPKKKFLSFGVKVLYDDASVVIIHKPAGLLSVATDLEKEFTAHNSLKQFYKNRTIFVVHRLDQDTSGLMMFALNEKACIELKKLFETHLIKRSYCAIVEGKLTPKKGIWSSYLFEDDNYKVHSTQDETVGKKAVTHYNTTQTSKRFSFLDIELETGRKNQIRVQASDAQHPIVGDKKYGATFLTKRLYLHAYQLKFQHPETKKEMTFLSPIPSSFYELMNDRGNRCTKIKFG